MSNAFVRLFRRLFPRLRGGLSVPAEWRRTQGEGVKVLVIDSGAPADADGGAPRVHPDLQHALLLEECKSFVWGEDIFDAVGHSTAVCGIIAAGGRNAYGAAGYAPKAKLVTYKAAGANGRGSATDLRRALSAAAELRPDIVCVGIAVKSGASKMVGALKRLEALGIPVVCAAGNDGDQGVMYPAKFPQTIAVGARGSDGREATFSARGPEIDCLFPGVRVRTLWKDGGCAIVSGTSYAAPAAAAIAALYVAWMRGQQDSDAGGNRRILAAECRNAIRKAAGTA